jgi:hypothetical protein
MLVIFYQPSFILKLTWTIYLKIQAHRKKPQTLKSYVCTAFRDKEIEIIFENSSIKWLYSRKFLLTILSTILHAVYILITLKDDDADLHIVHIIVLILPSFFEMIFKHYMILKKDKEPQVNVYSIFLFTPFTNLVEWFCFDRFFENNTLKLIIGGGLMIFDIFLFLVEGRVEIEQFIKKVEEQNALNRPSNVNTNQSHKYSFYAIILLVPIYIQFCRFLFFFQNPFFNRKHLNIKKCRLPAGFLDSFKYRSWKKKYSSSYFIILISLCISHYSLVIVSWFKKRGIKGNFRLKKTFDNLPFMIKSCYTHFVLSFQFQVVYGYVPQVYDIAPTLILIFYPMMALFCWAINLCLINLHVVYLPLLNCKLNILQKLRTYFKKSNQKFGSKCEAIVFHMFVFLGSLIFHLFIQIVMSKANFG